MYIYNWWQQITSRLMFDWTTGSSTTDGSKARQDWYLTELPIYVQLMAAKHIKINICMNYLYTHNWYMNTYHQWALGLMFVYTICTCILDTWIRTSNVHQYLCFLYMCNCMISEKNSKIDVIRLMVCEFRSEAVWKTLILDHVSYRLVTIQLWI